RQRFLDQGQLFRLDHFPGQAQRGQNPGADRLGAEQHHVDPLAALAAFDPGEIAVIAFPGHDLHRDGQAHQARASMCSPCARNSPTVRSTRSGMRAATAGVGSMPRAIEAGSMPTMTVALGARPVNSRLARTSERPIWCGDSLVLKKTGTASPLITTWVAGGEPLRTQSTTTSRSRFSSCSSISMAQVPP